MSQRRARMAAALLATAAALTGCSQQLFGELPEHEANEVVGALRAEGIPAQKTRAGERTWSTSVPPGDFARAVAILRNQNLPAQSFDGLGQVFRKDSLVSSETEERARLIHAMAQELQRTLSQIDGVVVARVHPVILPREPFSTRPRVASAAVFIKHRASVDMAAQVPMIRELVAHGVEDLDERQVSVALYPAESRALPAQPSGRSETVVTVLAAWAAAALLLAASVLWLRRAALARAWQSLRRRRDAEHERQAADPVEAVDVP